SDRFVVGGLGVFDLLEQVDGNADEVGVGDDAPQFATGDDRQTADTVPLEEQRGLSQAGVLIDGCQIPHHDVGDRDVAVFHAGVVVAQHGVRRRQHVGERHQTNQPALLVNDGQVTDAALCHDLASGGQIVLRRDRDEVGAHYRVDADHAAAISA